MSATVELPPRRTLRLATGSAGYVLLGLVLLGVLLVGSHRPPANRAAARVAALEGEIRCPSCDDLSIADSDSPSATGLRQEVQRLVAQGWSDAAIEARVEDQYPGTLLVPTGGIGVLAVALPLGAIALGGVALFGVLASRRRHRRSDANDEALVAAARRAP